MALGIFKKREYTATIQPSGQVVRLAGKEKLLRAGLAAGLDWPHDCQVGSCGSCRCKLKSGSIKPLIDFSYTLTQEEIKDNVILACQSILKSDIEIELALGAGGSVVEDATGIIRAVDYLTDDIAEIIVDTTTPVFRSALAGQYAMLSFDGLDEPRSYSFARRPGDGDGRAHTFVIRHVPGGEFTDWLFGVDRSGEAIKLSAPYGAFHLRPASEKMLCIAGGSGLAPIIALIEAGIAEDRNEPLAVLFGAREQRDLYYLERMSRLGESWRGEFELLPVLSDEPDYSGWTGARGLVTEHISALEHPVSAETRAYVCGPPLMVDAAIGQLAQSGLGPEAIFFDKFLDASTQPGGRGGVSSD